MSIRQSAGISNKVEVLRVCQSTCLLDYDSAQVCHGYLSKQHRAVSLKSHFPTSAENAKIRQHCEGSHRHRAILGSWWKA